MMKSFFKKLAFVMALAMVVTLAAPAAQASAATALTVALQSATAKEEAFTEFQCEVGATDVDFKYYYAPKNYKELNPTWSSSDETVATVDKNGVITALKDGVTTIKIALDNGQEGSVVLTVGKGDLGYTYKQKSHKEATFTFNQNVNYKVEDVTLTKVFQGGYEVNWPIETFKCEGNVVTIAPYVAFADGDQFIIKIGAEDKGTPFTTSLGVVDEIDVAFKSLDKNGKAFAKIDEDAEDIEVILSCKLFSNGVDVSEAPGYSLEDVEFELVEDSDDYELDENILIFEKPGVVAGVKVIYSYDVNGEDVSKEAMAYIVSEPAPQYTLVSVDAWTIAQRNNNDVTIDWNGTLTHSIPAFDENKHSIVVLMTDSYGNKIVYPNEFADNSKEINGKKPLALSAIAEDDSETFIEAAENFEIRYTSTNTGKVFVGLDDGDITTLGTSKAPVLVSLYDENSEGDTVLVKNMYAAPLEVTEQRRADKVIAKVNFDELLVDLYVSDTLPNGFVDDAYETGTVTFTVKDQYGKPVSGATVKISEANDNISISGTTGTTNNDGNVDYKLYGSSFYYYNSSKNKNVAVDSVKFSAEVVNTNVKTTFVVKTETPEVKNNAVVVEDYNIVADSVDMKSAKKADGTVKISNIKLYQTSNDLNVSLESKAVLLTSGNALLKDGTGAFSIKSGAVTEANKNNVYVVVYGPDGKALTQAASSSALGIYETNAGEYGVRLATASGSAMTYLATGTYTVKAYKVDKTYNDANKNAKLEDWVTTFTVSNTSDVVTLKEQDEINLSETAFDLADVIYDAFDFNLGGGTLNEDYAVITNVEYKYNASSNYVFIYNVTFDVPLNNADDDVYYTSGKVAINKAVEVNGNFSTTWK